MQLMKERSSNLAFSSPRGWATQFIPQIRRMCRGDDGEKGEREKNDAQARAVPFWLRGATLELVRRAAVGLDRRYETRSRPER